LRPLCTIRISCPLLTLLRRCPPLPLRRSSKPFFCCRSPCVSVSFYKWSHERSSRTRTAEGRRREKWTVPKRKMSRWKNSRPLLLLPPLPLRPLPLHLLPPLLLLYPLVWPWARCFMWSRWRRCRQSRAICCRGRSCIRLLVCTRRKVVKGEEGRRARSTKTTNIRSMAHQLRPLHPPLSPLFLCIPPLPSSRLTNALSVAHVLSSFLCVLSHPLPPFLLPHLLTPLPTGLRLMLPLIRFLPLLLLLIPLPLQLYSISDNNTSETINCYWRGSSYKQYNNANNNNCRNSFSIRPNKLNKPNKSNKPNFTSRFPSDPKPNSHVDRRLLLLLLQQQQQRHHRHPPHPPHPPHHHVDEVPV